MRTHSSLLPLLALPLALATGCSTVVHMGSPSGLEVKSRPSGASILVDGIRRGTTPAQIAVDGDSGSHVVRLEKKGYVPQEFNVDKSMSNWVWGNAPLAVFPLVAAAGVGIDATCGSWYRLDPGEIDATLAPVPPPDPTPMPDAPDAPASLPASEAEDAPDAHASLPPSETEDAPDAHASLPPSETEDAPDAPASQPPSLRGDAPEGQGGVHALPSDEPAPDSPGDGELSPPPAAENEQGSPEPVPAPPEPDDDGLAPPPVGDNVPLPFLP